MEDDKREIIKSFIPIAALKPMTEEAFEAIPQNFQTNRMVAISKLPFKIGRESRIRKVMGKMIITERPKFEGSQPNNDLYLIDRGQKLNISRNKS